MTEEEEEEWFGKEYSGLQFAGTCGQMLKWIPLFSTKHGAHWGPDPVRELFVCGAFGN